MSEKITVLDGLLQGLLQGLTEFLPISSSGHLSLYQHFTHNSGEGALLFTVMLHLGTLAAVVAVYYQDLWGMLKEVGRIFKEIFSGSFSFKTQNDDRRLLYMLFFACLPMLLLILLNGVVSKVSQDDDIVIEGLGFLFTSLLLFGASRAKPGKGGIRQMKAPHALIVGAFQTVASLPGVSRSGSTISSGIIIGFDRQFMAKFSFLLGIPAILGGVALEMGDAMKQQVEIPVLPMLVGILTAAVSGYFCIRLVKYILQKNRLSIFAWYTLVLGAVVVVVGLVEHIATGIAGGLAADPSSATSALAALVASL